MTKTTKTAERNLSHTIAEILEDAGVDPENAIVTDASVTDGVLSLSARENPASPDKQLVAELVVAGDQTVGFAERTKGDYRGTVFSEGSTPVIELETLDGESHGDPYRFDVRTWDVILAAAYMDPPIGGDDAQ